MATLATGRNGGDSKDRATRFRRWLPRHGELVLSGPSQTRTPKRRQTKSPSKRTWSCSPATRIRAGGGQAGRPVPVPENKNKHGPRITKHPRMLGVTISQQCESLVFAHNRNPVLARLLGFA